MAQIITVAQQKGGAGKTVLSHLQIELEQNWQKSDFRRYEAINILKFSKVETLLLEPMI